MCVRACVRACVCVRARACAGLRARARMGVNKHFSGHGIQKLMVKLDHCCCALLAHIVMGLMIDNDDNDDNDQDVGDGDGSDGTNDIL